MEKKREILIGLTVVVVVLVIPPLARASMSRTTMHFGETTFTASALWDPVPPAQDNLARAIVTDNMGGSSYDGHDGVAPVQSFASLGASSVAGDVLSEYGSAVAEAHPETGVEIFANALIYQQEWRFVVTSAGSLSLTLPYAFSVQTTTQNSGDWASAELTMLFAVTDETDGTWLTTAGAGWSQSSFDGTIIADQVHTGEWTITTDLEMDHDIRVWWYGEIWGRAYTADVAPVPVPGAALLGLLGLSAASLKLRKHS